MLLKKIISLAVNNIYDVWTFALHSGVFSENTQSKIEGKIVYYYHSIEKGLINDPIRYGFGAYKVKKLLAHLITWLMKGYESNNSQFIAGCSILMKYYKLHIQNNVDISAILTEADVEQLRLFSQESEGGVVNCQSDSYFIDSSSPFDSFSNSRHSVRHFNEEEIPESLIRKVVDIARNAPSVCNRQSVSLKYVINKKLIHDVLDIQQGMRASAKTVNQLFVVTSNRSSFVSGVERNQPFVDGGIFLMNLLYALHLNNIAACPLHCTLNYYDEVKIKRLLNMDSSEKIISFVAIGYPQKEFNRPYSKRKDISELITVIK